jgi:Carboxypeptidase regulatory-like domain/Concanavalin A-like lectin/glucanases superfamily
MPRPIRLQRIWQVLNLLGVCLFSGLTVGAQAPGEKPLVLISEANSTRAIAFETVTFRKEPFVRSTPFASDGRTRIMVFALNLALAPNEGASAITADAETAAHTHLPLQVEYAAPLSSLPWLSSIILRLNDDVTETGDVLIGLTLHGVKSNRVRIGIGVLGGGPPDDDGAGPTLAPPYLISGRVTAANGDGMSGVTLALNGDQVQAITTDASGSYSFLVNTFGNYTLSATKAFFNFTPPTKTFNNLSNTQSNVNFSGVRQTHSVSGTIFDNHNNPAGGVSVALSDSGNGSVGSVTTNADGAYVFANVPAGLDYHVTPAASALLTFVPQNISTLDQDLVLNFVGVPRKYTISGRVVDSNNQAVTGINLILSGTETARTKSDSNGNYSLPVTASGNYTVTAAVEQDFCTFAPPSQSVVNLIGDQVFNYSVTFKPLPDPQQVLEFDGTPKTVDYGNFWPAFKDLGPFFWEFWAMPGNNASATYMLSDGYGGLHALLFGFSNLGASEPNRYEMSGNMNDGIGSSAHIFSFGSDSGPTSGEWGYLAVGWDGQNIITYFDGVPVGKTPYARPRQSTGIGNGAGRLLIGGSDHSNFHGRIAQVRGYEGSNPRMSRSVEASFTPQIVFSREANLLSYYFLAAPTVADFSRGYITGSHVGVPRGTTTGVLGDCGSCPPPQFVFDPTAPNFATGVAPQSVGVPQPLPVPGDALVFDSFSRLNSTYMFGGKGGLGSTEGGAAGPQVWQMKADADQLLPFGILNGRVVLLADDTAMCWVNTGSTSGNVGIMVSRQHGRWGSGIDTGLSFRVVDESNYFFAYTSDSVTSPGDQFLNIGSVINGARSMIATGIPVPSGWTTLRVGTRANGTLRVFIDNTQVYDTNIPALANANKAGLFNNSAGLGLVNRWDNFYIFDVGLGP